MLIFICIPGASPDHLFLQLQKVYNICISKFVQERERRGKIGEIRKKQAEPDCVITSDLGMFWDPPYRDTKNEKCNVVSIFNIVSGINRGKKKRKTETKTENIRQILLQYLLIITAIMLNKV